MVGVMYFNECTRQEGNRGHRPPPSVLCRHAGRFLRKTISHGARRNPSSPIPGVWTPPRLLVSDTQTGKQVPAGEIPGKTDDLLYDSGRRRVYVRRATGTSRSSNGKCPTSMTESRVTRLCRAGRRVLLVSEWGKPLGVPAQRRHTAKIRVYVTRPASSTEGGRK